MNDDMADDCNRSLKKRGPGAKPTLCSYSANDSNWAVSGMAAFRSRDAASCLSGFGLASKSVPFAQSMLLLFPAGCETGRKVRRYALHRAALLR